MNCWNVVDDIDMLYEYFGDNEFFKGMDPKHADEIMNCMLGLKSLYQVKFEKTWQTFEDVAHRYHNVSKERDAFKNAWPEDDERIDNIGRNGNDGLHYNFESMRVLGEKLDVDFDFVDHERQERKDKETRRSNTKSV